MTASDLNAEYNNILNNALSLISPLTGTLDLDGNELILDADGDTSITADTDDQIDFRAGGTDRVRITSTGLNVVSGTLQENGASIASIQKRAAGMAQFKASTVRAVVMGIADNVPLNTQVFY